MKGVNGVIGFFDILGYQNFLENNTELDSTREVLKIIDSLPSIVIERVKNGNFNQNIKKISKSIEHLVFSDTIVITVPFPENSKDNLVEKKNACDTMILIASNLTAQMFEIGLPLRGVIHEGEYIIEKNCLAGRAIIESYKLCENLDFSGLVCSIDFTRLYLKFPRNEPMENAFLFFYLTPLKNSVEIKLVNVNWTYYYLDEKQNLDDYVLRSFWAFQKDCSTAVDNKIRNTIKSLRKMRILKSNYENQFKITDES